MLLLRKNFPTFLLFCILIGAFYVRLYQFGRPVADWHAWRQVDTSAVSRNFVKYGFDVFHPKFDDLSKGVSLLDNPKGYRFVEFPIYNVLQAGLFIIFDRFTIEQWGRIVTIVSQLITILFLYALVRKYIGQRAAIIASSFYAFVPYNIYFGRTILPDSTTVMATMGGIYYFDIWIERFKDAKKMHVRYFLAALIFTASALLLKPFSLFFLLPLVYLTFKHFRFLAYKQWALWIFLIASVLPFLLWRLWMQQYPEGIPQSNWLFNQYGIRFTGAFFRWLFADRIGSLILGFFGLPFVILAIVAKNKKEGLFFYSFLVSSLLYLTVIAYGNVHHDYYQILIVPTLAIFFAKGTEFLLSHAGSLFHRFTTYVVIFVCIMFMLAFGWFRVRDFYNLQHVEVLSAGAAVDKLTPKDAKVIAPYGGDTTLLYYTDRKGWPVWDRPLKQFVKEGAEYLVFVKPGKDELNFKNQFVVLDELDKEYVIYDLTNPLVPIK